MQFTADYSDNVGATAQVFVSSTRSETGRFMVRIHYQMVLKQVELAAGTSVVCVCLLSVRLVVNNDETDVSRDDAHLHVMGTIMHVTDTHVMHVPDLSQYFVSILRVNCVNL